MAKKHEPRQKPKMNWARMPTRNTVQSLAVEKDRSCVLVGAAIIEFRLEILILNHWMKINDTRNDNESCVKLIFDTLSPEKQSALVGTGYAKSVIALLSGLIDKPFFDAYTKIRQLRNEFAHMPYAMELNDPQKVDAIANTLRGTWVDRGLPYWCKSKTWTDAGWGRFSPIRRKFMGLCIAVDLHIFQRAIKGREQELEDMVGGAVVDADGDVDI